MCFNSAHINRTCVRSYWLVQSADRRLQPNRQQCFNRFAIKKTCPFEFTRHGRLKAGTEARPSFLPRSVSQCELQKGSTGFQAMD
jgi:hypothetical protein